MPPEDDQTPTTGMKIASMYNDSLPTDEMESLANDIDEAIKSEVMGERERIIQIADELGATCDSCVPNPNKAVGGWVVICHQFADVIRGLPRRP